jgi:hypothetical protein
MAHFDSGNKKSQAAAHLRDATDSCRDGAWDTALSGWGERTRTRKCRFFEISAELVGLSEHFRTREFWRGAAKRWTRTTPRPGPAFLGGLYELGASPTDPCQSVLVFAFARELARGTAE